MSSYTYTDTGSVTFNVSHARELASKVATDLLRFQRLYQGVPSDATIDSYERELAVFLRHDLISCIVYGFKRNGKWTEASVKYDVLAGGKLQVNDDPGKIRPNLDVAGASFTSFVTYNSKWSNLPQSERDAIERELPFSRVDGTTPSLESGNWVSDLNYTAGGRGLGRSSVRR